MPPPHLTKFEIQKDYENESTFSGVNSRHKLSKGKDGQYSWWVSVKRNLLDSFIC